MGSGPVAGVTAAPTEQKQMKTIAHSLLKRKCDYVYTAYYLGCNPE